MSSTSWRPIGGHASWSAALALLRAADLLGRSAPSDGPSDATWGVLERPNCLPFRR